MTAALLTAILAFLDTDAAYGPEHPQTQSAKATLRDAVTRTVHEVDAVVIEHVPFFVSSAVGSAR